jgi:ubiquinone/menaquinone biosynthesis C-methylase UbiE
MATPLKDQEDQPSTYLVHDRSNQEEMNRLHIQDQMFTAGMGGVLPEQTKPERFRRILDVGCGTGGWLIETAQTYPGISSLIGVDISSTMIKYAREQAMTQGVSERVEFYLMDALRMLEFPDKFFDLINQRGGTSWLRTWDWSNLLKEYLRVVRGGGVIRITETENVTSTSPAFTRFSKLLTQALHQAGYDFHPDAVGVVDALAPLMSRADIQQVQTRSYQLEYRAGTPEWQNFFEDAKHFFSTYLPFLRKWIQIPNDYGEMCQQALQEMQQPDFVAIWHLVTVWGIAPPAKI